MPPDGMVRATHSFWPVTGASAGRKIDEGMVLAADDRIVSGFPEFFEAVASTPVLTVGPTERVEIRCTGTRPDGKPCNQLIVKANRAGPLGIEGKCSRCGLLVAA